MVYSLVIIEEIYVMKKYRNILALIMPFIIFMLSSCKSTYIGRYVKYFIPDIEEPKKFPSTTISKAPSAYNFIDATGENKLDGLKIIMWGKEYNGSLNDFLKATKTNAFVVIRNDSILCEKYFNGYTRESLNYSFSVTKSVTSMPLFTALDKGYINSLDDRIIKYIPELDSLKSGTISIRNLIDMHSGIKHNHSDWPWGDEAKHYYKPNIRKHLLTKLKIDCPPGQQFE
jgi:hypothetical protein